MTVVDVSEKHKDLVDELLTAVSEYNPDLDRELLSRAFSYAAAAHEGQLRRSGEEFIRHPWSVAKICADFDLDYWLRRDREGGFPLDFHTALARAG